MEEPPPAPKKARASLMQRLLSFSGGKEAEPAPAYLGFGFIFVFPLPSSTTEADEKRFTKEFLKGQKTHQSIMDDMVIHTVARSDSKFSIECGESLKSMRNVTIEIFQTFFHTMFGDDPDNKLFEFTSVEKDKLFMCVKMGDRLAEQFADMADYPLQLDISAIEKLNIKISDLDNIVPAYVRMDAYQKDNGLLRIYPKPECPEQSSILRRVDRLRLMYDKITDYIDLPEMELMGLVSYFPCHNLVTMKTLRREWATLSRLSVVFSLSQPIDKVRDYLGEGVAFYFLFVQELAKASLLLLPVSAVARYAMLEWPEKSDGHDLVVLCYCLYLVVWFVCFNKHWKRTESYYSNSWGMDCAPSNTEIHELLNPKFSGEMRPWPVDENEMVEEPIRSKLMIGWAASILGQLVFIALIVVCVSWTQYTASVAHAKGNRFAHSIAAFGVTVQIQVFGLMWDMLSARLTDEEQHVTMRSWNESQAVKSFVVSFFNTFFPFFYVGFIQKLVDPTTAGVGLLRTNMEITYGTLIMFGLKDMLQPWIVFQFSIWSTKRAVRKGGGENLVASFLENQDKLAKYKGTDLTADFMQIAFSISFVVLFSAVMPCLTVFLAFLTFVIQLRADAWKLLNTYRRTFPDMVDGIGMWNKVLGGLEILMVCVNLLLLITHYDMARFLTFIPGLEEALAAAPTATSALIFFVLLLCFMGLKALLDQAVPNEPERTSLEKKRQALQRQRLLEREAEFTEQATMWAKGDHEASAFHEVPPLRPGDTFYCEHA